MQVSIETIGDLGRSLTITVSAEAVKSALHAELVNMAKKVHVDGFRKGKASLGIIKQRYGSSILKDTLNELMQQYFIDAVVKENLNLVGSPIYRPDEYEMGRNFTFKVEFEVYPEITLKGLEQVEIERPVAQVLDSDVEAMIERLRKQLGSWQIVDREVQQQDRVILDFNGTIEGKEFDGGQATDFTLVLGQNSMIPGFEEAVLGHKVGDRFDIDVIFPESYHVADLRGKPARFSSFLKRVEELVLPPLTGETIKRFGVVSGTLDALKIEVRRSMERELASIIKLRIKNQIVEQLVQSNEINVPSALLSDEIDVLHKKAIDRFKNSRHSLAEIPKALFETEARKRVTAGLLFRKIIETHKIVVDSAYVKKLINDIASTYEDPSELVAYYSNNERAMKELEAVALEDQVINFLSEKAQVVEKRYSFSELASQVSENK